MLPHNHFLIAGAVITPVALILLPEKSVLEVGRWVLVGGLLSSAIDLDVLTLVLLKSKKEDRLKPFRNLLEVYRKFQVFMDTITETGVLRMALKTHLVFSIFLILYFYFFLNRYFVPVTFGVVSHIISDIPNMRRIVSTSAKQQDENSI